MRIFIFLHGLLSSLWQQTLEQLLMLWEFLSRMEPEPDPPGYVEPMTERPPPLEVVLTLLFVNWW